MEFNLVAEAVGFIGMIILPLSLQAKDKNTLLVLAIVGCLAWSLHFYLLDELSGSVILAIAAARYWAAIYTKDNRVKNFFIVIAVLTLPFTYTVWYSVIPVISAVVITAVIFQDNMDKMRKFFILEASLWLSYSILSSSYTGTITDLIILFSAVLGWVRHEKPELIDKLINSFRI